MENTTTYSLAAIDSPNITGIQSLTHEEFKIFFEQIGVLDNFRADEALFRIIELNHEDLKNRENFYLQQYQLDPQIDSNEFSMQFLDLNRLILNLLSSIRTYLDHTETRLKKTYGEQSSEFQFFKKATSEAFDNNFEYRFLVKLRNYSQHCGLPTGSISLTDDQNGQSLSLMLVRDKLIENYDAWGALVKPDLQKQDEQFDVFPVLDKKINLLKKINSDLSEILLEKISEEGKNLLSLILLVQTKTNGIGIPCLLEVSGTEQKASMKLRWFPFDIISRITGANLQVINKK
ncbi:hypothetical protein [Flavobacterium seoulense]|uniref:Uncharacterized protein n=1 Tax=Flavobacterium seoulense TaxID=1492738 RepID=A0A066WUE1_9FLAO|nr:hypothetical protein [Flavobacterium seoulense]KDN54584.1 hypothetical protein FEM21_23070 [Flavobacterium seoulense]